jgi:hypothetical protein
VATADALRLLVASGFDCRAYCACKLDFGEEVVVEQFLAEQELAYHVSRVEVGGRRAKLVIVRHAGMSITLFRNQFTQLGLTADELPTFLGIYEQLRDETRPDVLLTYGGGPIGDALIDRAKERNLSVVFLLHNFAYDDPASFRNVDYVVVPSEPVVMWSPVRRERAAQFRRRSCGAGIGGG